MSFIENSVVPFPLKKYEYSFFETAELDPDSSYFIEVADNIREIRLFTGSYGVKIVAFENYYAHSYALRENIPFYPLEEIMCPMEDYQG